MRKFIAAIAVLAALTACQQKTESTKTENSADTVATAITPDKAVESTAVSIDFSGNYVDASYADRDKGNDWISAAINKLDDNTITVSIRSRSDIKKPTCTFDAKATKKTDYVYEAKANDATVLFTFEENQLKISTENPDDVTKLMYFCSGGGNFVGSFSKIPEKLDGKQVDNTPAKF